MFRYGILRAALAGPAALAVTDEAGAVEGLAATGACAMLIAGMLAPALAPWLARESLFEFTAREPKNRKPAEPGTAPNDGPATPGGNSEVTDGPPSVS
jgi:hypothetical protein